MADVAALSPREVEVEEGGGGGVQVGGNTWEERLWRWRGENKATPSRACYRSREHFAASPSIRPNSQIKHVHDIIVPTVALERAKIPCSMLLF